MNPIRTADAEYLLNSKPPLAIGLSRKSPSTAPSGLVRINAAQKRTALEMLVQKLSTTTVRRSAANIMIPIPYPKPAVSAVQSPKAVPNV